MHQLLRLLMEVVVAPNRLFLSLCHLALQVLQHKVFCLQESVTVALRGLLSCLVTAESSILQQTSKVNVESSC